MQILCLYCIYYKQFMGFGSKFFARDAMMNTVDLEYYLGFIVLVAEST